MRHVLTALALASWVGLAASPAVAQTQPEPGKKDAPPAATAPQPTAPPPAAKAAEPTTTTTEEKRKRRVKKARHRRHAHATRRHRAARHRHGWRNVWIYRAHDRHGDRHYEYVRRKFGGYFARGRADCRCRRTAAHAHRRWHM